MKLICKKDFKTLFKKGKEYIIMREVDGMIMICNHNSRFYHFSLEENTIGVTPYVKDTYYGDYFEKI